MKTTLEAAEQFLNDSEFSASSLEGEEMYIEKEDVLELMERYATAAVNAKLQEAAKLAEDEYVNWVVYDNHEDTINAIRDAILSLQIKQQ